MTTLRPELLDELLSDYETPKDLLGDEGLFKQLKKALLERALGAELSDHPGYEKGDPAGRGIGGRTVVVEFPSFEQALAAFRSDAYQAAAANLEGAVERDFRVVEGVE